MSRLVNNKRILSLYEAFFSSLVVGLAETYFVAFALHKGVSVIESGLLVSLPLLFAGVTPFLLNNLFNRFYNSTWVLIAMAIQAIAIASLTLIGFFDTHLIFYLLLFIFSIYWFGHFSALPSWNKWVAEFVSHDESQKYFSQRARLTQFGIIGGLIIGGAVLHLEILKVSTSLIFITLFLVSYHLKMAAFYFLYKLPKSVEKYQLDLKKKLVFFIKQKNFFKTYSVFNCSIYLSAPYVSGYLLNIRGLTYIQYMYVMGALFAGKIVTTYVLENFKVNLNPQKIFFIGGLIAAPLPALWPICDSVFAMFLVHFFSGIGWAAWEVGLSLVIYKNIKPSEKIEAVSLYNSVGLPVQVLGTVLGALLLKYVFNNNYNNLFILAGVLRFIFIIPMYYQKYGDENTII